MIRNVALMLLLATSIVLADDAPEANAEAKPAAKDDTRAAGTTAKPDTGTASTTATPDTGVARTAVEKKEDKKDEKKKDDASLGMSILGNQEAPKALVIVPWKSSQVGASPGVSTLLDDSRQPIDKEVFMRALSYYEIRSGTTRHDGAPAGTRPPSAAHGRK
jgi:hypothetical protein